MSEIEVTALEPGTYAVRVVEGGTATDHRVTATAPILQKLGVSDADPENVVRESFAFLLEREPATSILAEFSLDAISRYFPEYQEELHLRLMG
jgi:hypothetical protein